MRFLYVTLFFVAIASSIADDTMRRVYDIGSLPLKSIADKVKTLSVSETLEDRICAANVVSFYPAFISGKTEVEVVARLARDKDSKVRGATLGAIKSLVDVALIAPFLPIVKEMMDDPNKEVSSDACVLYRQLKEYECSFKKDGVTEDVARRKFFGNGLVPKLY